jgi:hypothetical protein
MFLLSGNIQHRSDSIFKRDGPKQIKCQGKILQNFTIFSNFQQKSRENFVRRKLKVNSILTSLAFRYQITVFFPCFLFLGFFGGFAEQDTHSSFFSQILSDERSQKKL